MRVENAVSSNGVVFGACWVYHSYFHLFHLNKLLSKKSDLYKIAFLFILNLEDITLVMNLHNVKSFLQVLFFREINLYL